MASPSVKETLDYLACLKNQAYEITNPAGRSALGQFYTPNSTALFMASMFEEMKDDVKLLDPGCGIGILTGAFILEAKKRNMYNSIECSLVDIENKTTTILNNFINFFSNEKINIRFENLDFINQYETLFSNFIFCKDNYFTHCIMNPPYMKIPANSPYRKSLLGQGIETGNLYSAFIAIAINKLKKGGELVAIIPRSFCNGSYFKKFRDYIINNTAIKKIHIFESRSNTFKTDDVLQENIIIHLIKGAKQDEITLSSSIDGNEKSLSDDNQIVRKSKSFHSVIHPNDKNKFIHIDISDNGSLATQQIKKFDSTLEKIGITVSTGPIVGFRSKEYLLDACMSEADTPILYPVHLTKKGIIWPSNKKPNGIASSYPKINDLWENNGVYVAVKRFSAKEEIKRINAYIIENISTSQKISFENKLNIYHINKSGLEKSIALGLFVYLNSTLVDTIFRHFSGHTQVNATDLRNINYPSIEILIEMGKNLINTNINQSEIDKIVEKFTR